VKRGKIAAENSVIPRTLVAECRWRDIEVSSDHLADKQTSSTVVLRLSTAAGELQTAHQSIKSYSFRLWRVVPQQLIAYSSPSKIRAARAGNSAMKAENYSEQTRKATIARTVNPYGPSHMVKYNW